MTHKKLMLSIPFRVALLIMLALPTLPGAVYSSPLQQGTNQLLLNVVSARTEPQFPGGPGPHSGISQGAPATTYRWLINLDNTADPTWLRYPDCSAFLDPPTNSIRNTAYPASCPWPSISSGTGYIPIVTQGDNTLLNMTTGFGLPNGKYVISVWAENFKIGGEHFTVPLAGPVTVKLQPYPLPPATISVKVFNDNAPVNGQPDEPAEQGLAGFRATILDVVQEVHTDIYNNPLCTTYQLDGAGHLTYDVNGVPIVDQLGKGCYSDANGIITIPNLAPNRYETVVAPPDGTNWVETTTLEGNLAWDTWVMEGDTGLDNEFVNAGEPYPMTIFGFVQPTTGPVPNPQGLPTGSVKGTIVNVSVYVPLNGGLPYYGGLWGGLSGAKVTGPIANPWVALTDMLNGDVMVYLGQGGSDGSFNISGVPEGSYLLTYFDSNLLWMLDFVQITVKGGRVTDVGTPFLTGWFTTVSGKVCEDTNENGRCESGEAGVPNFMIAVKRRDGSLMDRGTITMMTDSGGHYMLDQVCPLTQWLAIEAFSPNYRNIGYT